MKKRRLSILLVACMLLTMLPMTALADTDPQLTSVLEQTDNTPGSQSGANKDNAITWEISVANDKATLGRADIIVANEEFVLYSDAAFTTDVTDENTIALTAGEPTTVYIKILSWVSPGIYYAVTINRAAPPANAAPTATVQAITGILRVVATLTGHYTYSDVNEDLEGTSIYKWYRSDNAAGLNKATIPDATSITYVLQSADTGKYISFEVTPVAATGTLQGTAVESALTGPVAAATYATAAQLAAALGSATVSGNTVTLTGDVADLADTIQIEPSENITLNLAGCSISGNNGIIPLQITGGTSTLTITGNGRILGGSVDSFNAADAISISGGTVVIENASILGGVSNHGSGMCGCGDGIEISSGSLTIRCGAIKGGVDPGGTNHAGHGLNLRGGTVTIYDGSFSSGADLWNDSKAINASSGTVADIIAAGKIMKSYTDEGFTTGEAIIANDTALSALTSKYIRVQEPVVNAAAPVITNNLSTAQVEYSQNTTAAALDATATVTDGGSISYQWYSNTTNSTVGATALGVTTATYTPSTAATGTTYYYYVVTNTNNAVNGTTTAQTTSAIANIKVNAAGGGGSGPGSTVSGTPVITVSEVKSELFNNMEDIKVEADVSSAFGQSVTIKLTDDTESQKEIFSLAGANDKVYPFDISLYSKTSNEKVQPKDGYSVKITLPVPKELLDDREKIKVVYGKDGSLETLKSELTEKDGKWYLTFEATHFSPYALIVSDEKPVQPETAPWANPFSDVKASDWYYAAVQYAAQNGLMKGTGSNTFSPGVVTNRGMIATILYNLDGSEEAAQSTFKDVSPDAYYVNAVAWAQKKGIIAGYGNGMFGPDNSITREQLAAMIWKYAGSPAAADSQGLASFKDAEEISAYAQNALAWANQKGIINGKCGTLLDPKGPATRAEAAQIMQNFLQKSGLLQ